MEFKSLKDKCEFYRSATDYRLEPKSYVLAMVDGHCFSRLIKNKFVKPFDSDFACMMNETAKYLCNNIQGAKFAYTQSDEISILITDIEDEASANFFSFRLCKMQSLIAAMATAKFNQLYAKRNLNLNFFTGKNTSDIDLDKDIPLCTFDCKVWTVPNANDAYAWFLYRQNDCVRNSKQQFAQSYLPHKTLMKHTCDEQVEMVKEHNGLIWDEIPDGYKYGRLIRKTTEERETIVKGETIKFKRSVWEALSLESFNENNEMIKSLIPIKPIILNSRYGHTHKLVPVGNGRWNEYAFRNAEDWMCLRVIGDKPNYQAIDPDGGPFLGLGDKVDEIGTIESITFEEGLGFVLKFAKTDEKGEN